MADQTLNLNIRDTINRRDINQIIVIELND